MFIPFQKFVNTLKYKWFYVLASCIIPLTLMAVGTGRDIVAILGEGNLKNNTLYLGLGMMSLGISIWIIPTLPLNFYSFVATKVIRHNKKKGLILKINLFKHIYNTYNGNKTNDYLNYKPAISSVSLALLPWILLNIQILNFYFIEDLKLVCPIASMLTAIFIIFLYVINQIAEWVIKSRIFNKKRNATIAILLPTIVLYSLFSIIDPSGFGALVSYMVSSYILFNFIIVYLDLKFELNKYNLKLKNKEILKRINYLQFINVITISSTFIFLTILSVNIIKLNSNNLSGVILLVFGIIPYIFFIDNIYGALKYTTGFLVANYQTHYKTWRYLNLIVMLFFIGGCWILFIKNNNVFNKPESEKDEYLAYIKSEKYNIYNRFDKFYQKLAKNQSDTTPINIYLISGQGGGSRAAACFLNIMLNADILNKKWYNNIFSISTISGSSAGAMQYFYLHQLPDEVISKIIINNKAEDFSAEIVKSCYSYNYMNSNFLGLLYYDRLPIFMKKYYSKNKWYNKALDSIPNIEKLKRNNNLNYFGVFNRNYIQEEEERRALLSYIISKTNRNTVDIKMKMDSFYSKIANNYYCYKNLINDTNCNNPLFIMNTTMLSRGKKGFFANADINVNPNWTNLAFTNPYISMHSASLASQSVPILNTFYETYESVLCDGGFYENSGTSTTYDIYKQLRSYSIKKNYNVRFILVNIYNQTESIESETYGNSAFITTVKGLFSQIFNGHEKDALENIKKSTDYYNSNVKNVRDTVINFNLNYPVATTRSLRKITLDTILKRSIDSSAISYLASQILETKNLINENYKTSYKYILYPQTVRGSKFVFNEKKLKDCNLLNEINVQPVDTIDGDYINDIRYYHTIDADMSLKIKACLEMDGKTKFLIRDLSKTTYKNMVKPHTIEIWYK